MLQLLLDEFEHRLVRLLFELESEWFEIELDTLDDFKLLFVEIGDCTELRLKSLKQCLFRSNLFGSR